MKIQLLIISAVLALTGCQSQYPNYYQYGEFGFTYDDVHPVPGLTDKVAQRANQTLTPKKQVCEAKPEPDVGIVTFLQAPGTPPDRPAPWFTQPRPVTPVQPGPGRYYNSPPGIDPSQYPQSGPSGGAYPAPSGYINDPSGAAAPPYGAYGQPSSSYSDSEIFLGNGSGFAPGFPAQGTPGGGGGTPPVQFTPTPGFNPVPGAHNTADIPRFHQIPPGEPPGTELIPNRPFGQPPGTQLHDSYGVGTPPLFPPTTPFVGPSTTPSMGSGQLTPTTSPFAPAVNPDLPFNQSTPVQPMQPVQPTTPAIRVNPAQPAIPARPAQPQQQFLPGAVPFPRSIPGGAAPAGGAHK